MFCTTNKTNFLSACVLRTLNEGGVLSRNLGMPGAVAPSARGYNRRWLWRVQALIIAFTSRFPERLVYVWYYSCTGTLDGFVNNTLSYFNVSDFSADYAPRANVVTPQYNGTTLCRYAISVLLCLRQRSGWRHYVARMFVHLCMPESQTNIVSKISWVFIDGIWPNFRHWRTYYYILGAKDQGSGSRWDRVCPRMHFLPCLHDISTVSFLSHVSGGIIVDEVVTII